MNGGHTRYKKRSAIQNKELSLTFLAQLGQLYLNLYITGSPYDLYILITASYKLVVLANGQKSFLMHSSSTG